ncbi:TPA: hypothetical protein ACJEU7_001464 [Acinetobacter baumannii]|uniref:hypothetical protein n=1 Tax=Acinetobacter baumannii TaxID=470 RepID=UPI002258B2C0|nr:hypothetical protein [Acinetobacter baumannii]MCX3035307.1 hypothetical protein [Acinetobacter baumannii]
MRACPQEDRGDHDDSDSVNTHKLFKTINHEHVGRELTEVIIVECADGRWFIENNWHDSDLEEFEGVSNPHLLPYVHPTFFEDRATALAKAEEILRKIMPDFSVSEL